MRFGYGRRILTAVYGIDGGKGYENGEVCDRAIHPIERQGDGS
jgi:hypothetical protein